MTGIDTRIQGHVLLSCECDVFVLFLTFTGQLLHIHKPNDSLFDDAFIYQSLATDVGTATV